MKLSNIRDFLGWTIGRTVIDVTAGDPRGLPDSDPSDRNMIVLHFDNGGFLEVDVPEGFIYNNPDEKKP